MNIQKTVCNRFVRAGIISVAFHMSFNSTVERIPLTRQKKKNVRFTKEQGSLKTLFASNWTDRESGGSEKNGTVDQEQ